MTLSMLLPLPASPFPSLTDYCPLVLLVIFWIFRVPLLIDQMIRFYSLAQFLPTIAHWSKRLHILTYGNILAPVPNTWHIVTGHFALNLFRISYQKWHMHSIIEVYSQSICARVLFLNVDYSPYLWDQLVQCCSHKHRFQLLWASLQSAKQIVVKDMTRCCTQQNFVSR